MLYVSKYFIRDLYKYRCVIRIQEHRACGDVLDRDSRTRKHLNLPAPTLEELNAMERLPTLDETQTKALLKRIHITDERSSRDRSRDDRSRREGPSHDRERLRDGRQEGPSHDKSRNGMSEGPSRDRSRNDKSPAAGPPDRKSSPVAGRAGRSRRKRANVRERERRRLEREAESGRRELSGSSSAQKWANDDEQKSGYATL